jgi:hypothetical protein
VVRTLYVERRVSSAAAGLSLQAWVARCMSNVGCRTAWVARCGSNAVCRTTSFERCGGPIASGVGRSVYVERRMSNGVGRSVWFERCMSNGTSRRISAGAAVLLRDEPAKFTTSALSLPFRQLLYSFGTSIYTYASDHVCAYKIK